MNVTSALWASALRANAAVAPPPTRTAFGATVSSTNSASLRHVRRTQTTVAGSSAARKAHTTAAGASAPSTTLIPYQ